MKIDEEINRILGKPKTLAEKFHDKTAMPSSIRPKTHAGLSKEQKRIYFKAYSRFGQVTLPKQSFDMKLKAALERRESRRGKTDNRRIPLEKLGTLIYYSCGLRYFKDDYESRRFYPSAGGRYPLEVYLISNNVSGLKRDTIYHYNVRGHYLEERPSKHIDLDKYFMQDFVNKSSAIVMITGVFKRTTMKYADRGYRHVLIEAGHLGQNIYLVGAALGLGICGISGFYDKNTNDLLDIDGVSESALYCFALS